MASELLIGVLVSILVSIATGLAIRPIQSKIRRHSKIMESSASATPEC